MASSCVHHSVLLPYGLQHVHMKPAKTNVRPLRRSWWSKFEQSSGNLQKDLSEKNRTLCGYPSALQTWVLQMDPMYEWMVDGAPGGGLTHLSLEKVNVNKKRKVIYRRLLSFYSMSDSLPCPSHARKQKNDFSSVFISKAVSFQWFLFCLVNKAICVICYCSPLTFNTALPKWSLSLLAPNHRLWLWALLCGLTC